jgi:hypothetical protein
MSNTGDGRDDEVRERAEDAGAGSPGERAETGEQRVDASPAEPAEPRPAEPRADAAVGETVAAPAAVPAESTTTTPAEPGPVGPGDTAVIEPAFVQPSEPPTSVEPPVGTSTVDERGTESATPASAHADTVDPGAPVEPEPEDPQSRLDAAVQRANAVPAGDERVDETPEPIAADSVRRETYVPPAAAAGAAGGASAAGAATLAPEPQGPQTVYVQAPTPPKAKTNRGFGVLVALIGTAVFAALYAGVAYLLFVGQAGADATELFVQFLSRPIFWIPIIAMFVGFALLAIIVNRGAWWTYAVFGLLVGVLVYFSYLGAALLTVRAWELTPQQAVDFINGRWLDPLAIVAGVIAREIPIWFGGWIAKRGRGVAERNRLATEAYDRELAAGPRPVQR